MMRYRSFKNSTPRVLKDFTPRERWQLYWMADVPLAIILGVVVGIAVHFLPNPVPIHPVIAGGWCAIMMAASFAMMVWVSEGGWRLPACATIFLAWSCYGYGWQSWESIAICCWLLFELFRLFLRKVSQRSSDNDDIQT